MKMFDFKFKIKLSNEFQRVVCPITNISFETHTLFNNGVVYYSTLYVSSTKTKFYLDKETTQEVSDYLDKLLKEDKNEKIPS